MNSKIKLSVIIISYNQEKYISEAIESVINQKTNFKYEILVSDDCSKDKTQEIIEKYEKKYPNLVKNIKHKKNLGGTGNLLYITKFAKGEYVTILEGDDYWIDENKIQKQVDFLENNPKYIGISHLQKGINLQNEFQGNFPKVIKEDCDINMQDFLKGKTFSSSSCLYRNIYLEDEKYEKIKELFGLNRIIGDVQLCTYLLSLGTIKVLAQPMMVYRIRNKKGESNYNSIHNIAEINLEYLRIYKALEEIYDYKYDFYNSIKECVVLGMSYSFCKLKLKKAIEIFKECPKKYRFKVILSFPITAINIIIKRYK